MAKIAVKTKVKKVKKKFPVEVRGPEFLGSPKIGKTEATDLDNFVGRTTKLNLMYVTNNVKNQNVKVTFKVYEASSGLAKTKVKEYEHISYFLGRFLKSGSSLIEDSFKVSLKEGAELILKPFIVTKGKASSQLVSDVREKARELLREVAKGYDDSGFFQAVINYQIQNQVREEVKKLFPLKTFEFKKVVLVEDEN